MIRLPYRKLLPLALIIHSLAFCWLQANSLPGQKTGLSTYAIQPQRIVWMSPEGVEHPDTLLKANAGQSTIKHIHPPFVLSPGENSGSIILDFGTQISGYLEIFTPGFKKSDGPRKLRVRFGESVAETSAELGERGAQNDHALRDQILKLPWFGKRMIGPSGFRFVRLDAIEGGPSVPMLEVRAMLQIRDVPYLGSFECPDERLNKIWQTGAWTVHLNMQDYLWDGIKRDRLVWLGDMHPEVSVISAVFGHNEVVPKSLDLMKTTTRPTQWINNISSYSMWWVIIHHDWYQLYGDLDYLKEQKDYLQKLLPHLAKHIDENGSEALRDGIRFLDWPTKANEKAVHEGLQALMVMTMDKGARLMDLLDDPATAELCRTAESKLRQHVPEVSGRKSPAALNLLAGLRKADAVAAELMAGGPKDLSTFYGYYVLCALGEAGETNAALDMISQYWGGMLDLGATTFWEDFDLEWTKNAARIDEPVPEGKDDIHGDYGAYCYKGFRHSFCHGWAGGPTAFLSHHVLGIQPAAPGFAKVRIQPNLGRLDWAEGSYPTPKGLIKVRHERQADGSIKSTIQTPPGVQQVD
ncbi:alpha-L-rhamnosidase [Coraliomargarita sinensis]|uniref:Alpha-L-rhamnosidase n=1 Tax=Coraliomargarita sinensis TaxID=2174842 RepID=A0A317ZFT9_9BACT|nr:alpha-L-rhamnosidase C-terminal domain-containing protein [Coraliomargarita sinensis]PXA04474.1 alpha-L-rhamnosidase [Coraliomargarita sinensis]